MSERPMLGCGCPDYLSGPTPSRRGLLKGLALGGVTTVVGSTVITMTGAPASAAAAGNDRGARSAQSARTNRVMAAARAAQVAEPANSVLVVLSLRGAADGMSLVVPHGDQAYYDARPTIAVPAASLVATDSFFGMHPSLSPLLPLWNAGSLAAVHATGLAVANRSHFSAMEEVEDADPGSSTRTGWLNRLLGTDTETAALEGLSVGTPTPPASMFGPQPVMSFSSLDEATIAGDDAYDPDHLRLRSLEALWGTLASPMGGAVRAAIGSVAALAPAKAVADNTAAYPDTDLGRALSSVARTLRGNVGVELVTVDSGDWDMHTDLGTLDHGRMLGNAGDLGSSIAAFFADLGDQADKVTLVTISEFGRRVAENANQGLDHGWGNVMFLAGAGVKGGRYYGSWPGLTNSLDADLTVTTDYRSVLAEVVAARTPAASLSTVFPGFAPATVGVMGA